ncbi:MAG: SPOR domain-containing protein [Pseudomonadota bacterium]
MSRHRIHILTSIILCSIALTACDEFPDLGGDTNETAAAPTPAAGGILRIEEREVERPDIYAIQARGLWDGRFSLGGRWIAVAENVKAERIRITNVDSGRVVEGALFQREANLPGPPLMVSMDAAQALGMQAGSPAELKVVVVRTETVEIPAAVPLSPAGPEDDDTDAREDVAPAIAAAPVERTGIDAEVVAAVTGVATAVAAAPPPAAAPASDPVVAEAGAVETGIGTSTLESTVLGALDAAETDDSSPPQDNAAPEGFAPIPGIAAQDGAPARSPNIQVATGSNKDGADAVARRLSGEDIPTTVQAEGEEGSQIFRVIAGPFATQGAFNVALAKLRELGYEDAFATE